MSEGKNQQDPAASTEARDAAATLVAFTDLDEADANALVEAMGRAAAREAIGTVNGQGPLPSNMTDLRAHRLRMICEEAGRVLSPREIEVIFRLTPTSAASIERRMRATYPQAVDSYFRDLIRKLATVKEAGSKGDWRYHVYFDDPAGLEYAKQLLQRSGLTRDVRVKKTDQMLDVPRRMEPGGESPLAVLGLEDHV